MTSTPRVPAPGDGALGPDDRERERVLVGSLDEHDEGAREAAVELLELYARNGVDERARAMLALLVGAHADPARRAVECLGAGARLEELRRYDLAVWAYSVGVGYEPTHPNVWYWLHNNLGFSLNQVGDHARAETCCRAAIRCQPGRANAHKNLGLALEAQGFFADAARAYVTAVETGTRDPRPLNHLASLVRSHYATIARDVPDAVATLVQHGFDPRTSGAPPAGAGGDGPQA